MCECELLCLDEESGEKEIVYNHETEKIGEYVEKESAFVLPF